MARQQSVSRRVVAVSAILLLLLAPALAADPPAMPPPIGPSDPRVAPVRTDEGSYSQRWFLNSFLDLREDHAEAMAEGKRFAVIFEQRGCPYCIKMHTEVLSLAYINDYVRANFTVLQLDLFGAREVIDFDGRKLTERQLGERWGILFTPTIVFFKENVKGQAGAWGRTLEAVDRMPGAMGPGTFYDMFVWVRLKLYEKDRNFQRFHVARHAEREALKAGGAPLK